MLTKITIRNFKRFDEAVIDMTTDLGAPVVLIGPNNSGKTTALQALALWRLGVAAWQEKRGTATSAKERPGFTVNRRDLTNVPVPSANLLWKSCKTSGAMGGPAKVRIEVVVDGMTAGKHWTCGLEFDYTNEESFTCRPLRLPGQEDRKVADCKFSTIPDEALAVHVAFLPPMSGLASVEPRAERGRIDVLLGEGQTAQVIRNLCAAVHDDSPDKWKDIVRRLKESFGVLLNPPEYVATRGEVRMSYRDEREKCDLDLSSAGRGLQQTLLLLAYMHARPGSVLLLDEPDAHLEILRQRSVFDMISEVARANGSQVIAASHSEVVLNEAASRGIVIAFVGKPHVANNQSSQVLKSLSTIGFQDYYLAEVRRWVLYLEGSTDLAILRAFAEKLGHTAAIACLKEPFVHYLGDNQPKGARDHFFALREAVPGLVGYAQFDRMDKPLNEHDALQESQWRRREVENYLCTEEVLLRVARGTRTDDLFSDVVTEKRVSAMKHAIQEVASAAKTYGDPDIWSAEAKASDKVLEPIFRSFAARLGIAMEYRKRDFHGLVSLMEHSEIDEEVIRVLDSIAACAGRTLAIV